MRRLVCTLALLGSSCASVSHPAVSEALRSAPAPARESWLGGIEYGAKVESRYDSNPFRYSDLERDNIENLNGPGQRFDGVEQDWDLITELALDARRGFELGDHTDLEVELEGEYNHFHYNDIGSYGKYGGALSLGLGSRNTLEFALEHTPDRFRKNYRLPSRLFANGSYEQTDLVLEYERILTESWSAGIGLDHYARDYDPVFSFRDRESDGVFVTSSVALSERVTLAAQVALADVDTGIENRGGLMIDRSFETFEFVPSVRTKLGSWVLKLELEYRRKEYTTDEMADLVRFDRVDDRYGARIEARKELGWLGSRLKIFVDWLENDSDVIDPLATNDETGYEQLVIGAALDFSM